MTVCIIPARKNSKRIKNKNIINFYGKPLIFYSLNAAIKSKIFKKIYVSTDSKKICKLVKEFNPKVITVFRSKKNSTDKAPIIDVISEVVRKERIKDSVIFCIYPTAPFIKITDLQNCAKKIKYFDHIITISEFPSPIERGYNLDKNGLVKMINKKNQFIRSQDFNKAYYDTGTFAAYKKEIITSRSKFKKAKTGAIFLQRDVAIDINEKKDLLYAKKVFAITKLRK
jgi:pseudaminic acid cytidylyltransferase